MGRPGRRLCLASEGLVDGSAGAGRAGRAGRVTWRAPLVVAGVPAAGRGGWLVGWGFEAEFAVGAAGELGAEFVDLFVVAVTAEQAEVVDVGGPSVFPPDDVVGLAEAVGGSADGAAPVSDGEGDALRRVRVAVLVAQPERLTLRVEEGRKDVGVEGQLEEFAGCQGGAVDEAGSA